jgi:hypothetical protein
VKWSHQDESGCVGGALWWAVVNAEMNHKRRAVSWLVEELRLFTDGCAAWSQHVRSFTRQKTNKRPAGSVTARFIITYPTRLVSGDDLQFCFSVGLCKTFPSSFTLHWNIVDMGSVYCRLVPSEEVRVSTVSTDECCHSLRPLSFIVISAFHGGFDLLDLEMYPVI